MAGSVGGGASRGALLQFAVRLAARRQSDIILALFVLLTVSIMLMPLPPVGLDIMLSLNLVISLTLLLISIYIPSPTYLSAFPSILLLTTMLRLALNIASTRLILLKGEGGALIHGIGTLVLGGDIVVGLVIFLILCLIQFLVVVQGAERVAEVAARFTLDAMPGKQMTIDADARAGAYDMAEATRRRNALALECQLYGAMDGAMKFVKGDTIAGLIITAINLLGGVSIGVLRNNMTLADAAETYCILSVGDGIVAQIPSMLITLCAGMIITRVNSDDKGSASLGHTLGNQLFHYPKPLAIAGAFLLVLALIPGMPTLAFLTLGGLAIGGAWKMSRPVAEESYAAEAGDAALPPGVSAEPAGKEIAVAKAQRANVDEMLPMVTPILLELSPSLAEVLNQPNSRLVSELIPNVRDSLFYDLGIRYVNVRIRANPYFRESDQFVVYVHEVPQNLRTAPKDRVLVAESTTHLRNFGIEGQDTVHPITGARASWVAYENVPLLEAAGLSMWEQDEYIALELQACLQRNAARFLGMHEVQTMLDQVEASFPAMVREVVPRLLNVGRLTDILKRLVDEGVSIRDLKTILESVARWAPVHEDNADLAEAVRADLSDAISHKFGGMKRTVAAYLLAAPVEEAIRDAIGTVDGTPQLLLDPELTQRILQAARAQVQGENAPSGAPVFLADPEIRRYARQLFQMEFPSAVVLSYRDLNPDMVIEPLGWITADAMLPR